MDTRKIRTAMNVLIGCLVLFTTIFTCLFLGICRPLKAYWNTGVDAVCLSDNVVENIVIAQGGRLHLPIVVHNKILTGTSPLDNH